MAKLTRRHNSNVTIDAKDFDKVVEELARYTGKTFEEIIQHEASRILETSIEKTGSTKKLSTKRINARYTYTNDTNPNPKMVGRVNINGRRRIVRKIRKKGAMLLRGRGKNRKKVWVATATNPDWKPLQAELKRLKARKLKTIGQSKGTWVYVARRAGLKKVKAPAYVTRSVGGMTSNLKAALNGSSGGKMNYVVTLKNFGKVAMIRGGRRGGADGFAVFRRAFNGRVGYFEKNLTEGVFKKTSSITRKYRGMMVTPVEK